MPRRIFCFTDGRVVLYLGGMQTPPHRRADERRQHMPPQAAINIDSAARMEREHGSSTLCCAVHALQTASLSCRHWYSSVMVDQCLLYFCGTQRITKGVSLHLAQTLTPSIIFFHSSFQSRHRSRMVSRAQLTHHIPKCCALVLGLSFLLWLWPNTEDQISARSSVSRSERGTLPNDLISLLSSSHSADKLGPIPTTDNDTSASFKSSRRDVISESPFGGILPFAGIGGSVSNPQTFIFDLSGENGQKCFAAKGKCINLNDNGALQAECGNGFTGSLSRSPLDFLLIFA